MIKVNGKLVSDFDPNATFVFRSVEFLDGGEITGKQWAETSDGSYLNSIAMVLPVTLIRWNKYNWVSNSNVTGASGVNSIAVYDGKVFGIKG